MAYDEMLASRVRPLLACVPGTIEKKMFGGLAFLVNGNMSVGIHGAELIVRIDPAQTDAARGASVYTLSDKGSDALAEAIASRENSADAVNGVALADKGAVVTSILVDLARRATNNVSVQFADTLQDGLEEQEVRFRGEFHHFAAFAVLKAPDVPSVLLETGYVTNKSDAERLFSSDGRRRMARGIARAIERHLTGK